jgi:hypothetical protein
MKSEVRNAVSSHVLATNNTEKLPTKRNRAVIPKMTALVPFSGSFGKKRKAAARKNFAAR